MRCRLLLIAILVGLSADGRAADEQPIPQETPYAPAMIKAASSGKSRPGVVLHIGDSITYSNPYGQWARFGEGKTAADKEVLAWMHAGRDDDRDGWYLARFDHPDGGRSHTAASGLMLDQLLLGGKAGLPSLDAILDKFRPQAVVLMVGTNDVSARRTGKEFEADFAKAVASILAKGAVPIVSTIPPHHQRPGLAAEFNDIIRRVAVRNQLPLIDYEREILKRRRDDWNGTLMQRNDVHPSGEFQGAKASSAPSADNLSKSGYLLRGWLTVRKLAEVKKSVFDQVPKITEKSDGKSPVDPTPVIAPIREGEWIDLPFTRDTWLSNVGEEGDGSNGGSPRLKIKSHQEMTLFDVDVTKLRGRTIVDAQLFVTLAGPERLHRVTVGTVGAEWVEGKGTGYALERGASTFNRRMHPDVPWTIPGSDLCSVILSQGGTLWSHADAADPDENRRQIIPVDPKTVMARAAGLGFGFIMYDDTGSEWIRNGESFTFRLMPNRFIFSRESGAKTAPFLRVRFGPKSAAVHSPPAPTDPQNSAADLPVGQALVSWVSPPNVLGFDVRIGGMDVPRYLIPMAGRSGDRVRFHLRDLNLAPGSTHRCEVRAVDASGNRSNATAFDITVSKRMPAALPGTAEPIPQGKSVLPKVGGATIAVLDELDKVDPVTGKLIPEQSADYAAVNHLWDARKPEIRLYAGRNEIIGFQVAINGSVEKLRAKVRFGEGSAITAQVSRYRYVTGTDGPTAEIVEPWPFDFSLPFKDARIPGQTTGSLHIELVVPAKQSAGEHLGVLELSTADQRLEIPIRLTVWNFALPNHLSFIPDMNGYGLPAPERGYYRAAHRHRTVVNIVPYTQKGEVYEGWAPDIKPDGTVDFTVFDRKFGDYFDGSAFRDLPRGAVPSECFMLPLHENWPLEIDDHYSGGYWADRSFTPAYRRRFVDVSKQMMEHIRKQGWNDTMFQCFLNNKVDYKRRGWSKGSAPWLLDEPASFQDFWALRYYARAFEEGRTQAGPGAGTAVFRADISRMMWQRDSLDGLLIYNVVSSEFRRYHRMVMDRREVDRQVVIEYGTAGAVERTALQPAAWCWDAWTHGADGVLPWSAIGSGDAWKKAEQTSLFYPPRPGETEPTPSIRLKSFLRGQQDVEYLTLWSTAANEPRWAVADQIRKVVDLKGRREGTGVEGEDAGVIQYSKLRPQDLWAVRMQLGRAIDAARPPDRDRLIDFRRPVR